MICGNTFVSSGDTFISHVANGDSISKMVIQQAIFDELYVTSSVVANDDFDGTIPSDWTFDTRFHALFNNNLHGGNVSFTEEIVELIRIKKRTSKDTKFQTIYEKQINANEDFNIEYFDYLEPVGMITYAYVPVISGGESTYITATVNSSFDSCFLIEKGKSYPIILDSGYTETINYETGTVKPFGRKYPITIVNGNTGYKTGDISGTFIELKREELPSGVEIEYYDTGGVFDYRQLVYEFLIDNKPKIFKDIDGNILMINVNSSLTESNRTYCHHDGNGVYYVTSKFSWVECGDPYYTGDLYDNDFIDVDTDR